MKFFIAGIMQGSILDVALHDQNYRSLIKNALLKAFPSSEVYDPLERNQDSLFYTYEYGKTVFLNHNKMCGTEIDALVAYIPEASMGTAIEIWEAWKNNKFVVVISPMKSNWVVKYLSDVVYNSLEDFLIDLENGKISQLISNRTVRNGERESFGPSAEV
ncbi:MAG: hypothetical protein ACI4NV_09490 [Thermoguttaceae bacterium]